MILDNIASAFRNLMRKKLRSTLTMLGIIIGITSVLLVFSIGEGSKKAVINQFDKFGLSGAIIKGELNENGITSKITLADIENLKNKYKNSLQIMPIKSDFGQIVYKDTKKDCYVWGVGENAKEVITLETIYGNPFSIYDIKANQKYCIIDDETSLELFKTKNSVGRELTLVFAGKNQKHKIKAVVKTDSSILSNIAGEYIPSFIYVPYTSFQTQSSQEYIDQIVVNTKDLAALDEVSKNIVTTLSHNTSLHGEYSVSNLVKQKQRLIDIFDIITILISSVAAISLLVSGLSIMTIMLVAVSERTREIGIRKSIGATKMNIVTEFIYESLIVTLTGGIIGVITSLVLSGIINYYFKFQITITPFLILLSLLFSIVIGIIFSVYPAKKAANLDPISALRYE